MLKKIAIKSSIVLLCCLLLTACASTTTYNETETPPVPMTSDEGVVWLVAPTLEHEYIRRCNNCGEIRDGQERLIDLTTGLLTGEYRDFEHVNMYAFGTAMPGWAYDPQTGLFGHPGLEFDYCIWSGKLGMHPLNEFDERVSAIDVYGVNTDPYWEQAITNQLERLSGAIAVQRVDYSLKQYEDPPRERLWFIPSEGRSGRYALMYNREFITDFIFDHIIIIDETTAFAKYNGKYGIVDITRTRLLG